MKNHPALRGALLALLASLLFGASVPLVQRFGAGVGSWMTAAMLYAGAATAGLLLRSRTGKEAALQHRHWPRLISMALFGSVIGPAALAWGLQHTSSVSASLMLTQEAVFTVLLSLLLYQEHIDRRVGLAISLITSGGILLVLDRSGNGTVQVIGLLAVLGATVSWGVDNALSRALADRHRAGGLEQGCGRRGLFVSNCGCNGGNKLILDRRTGSFFDRHYRLWT